MPTVILDGGTQLEYDVQVGGCGLCAGLGGLLTHQGFYWRCDDVDRCGRCVFGGLLQRLLDLLCEIVQEPAGGDVSAGNVSVQWGRDVGVD